MYIVDIKRGIDHLGRGCNFTNSFLKEVRIVRMMLKASIISLIALYTIGCASWIPGRSSKSFLHGSGVLLLSKEHDVVEVDSDYELSVKWLVAGRLDSTRALVSGNSRPVRASVVEANTMWILLKSPSWKNRKDLPTEYLKSPDLYITLIRGTDRQTAVPPLLGSPPTQVLVGIPVAQIKEVSLYREDRGVQVGESPTVAGSIVAGACGGFLVGVTWLVESYYNDDGDHPPTAVDALVMGSIGAVVGAVGLPVYKKWKAWRAKGIKNTKIWSRWGQPLSIGEDEYTLRIKR